MFPIPSFERQASDSFFRLKNETDVQNPWAHEQTEWTSPTDGKVVVGAELQTGSTGTADGSQLDLLLCSDGITWPQRVSGGLQMKKCQSWLKMEILNCSCYFTVTVHTEPSYVQRPWVVTGQATESGYLVQAFKALFWCPSVLPLL